LSRAAVPHAYQRGQMIFYEGNPALAVYCVRSGMVKTTRQYNHGDATVVGVLTAGDVFGHRAVLSDLPYANSAEAIEPSVVCTIPREDFLALIEESHELSSHLLKRLAREFRFAEERLVERGGEPVMRRTARFLARMAEGTDPPTRAGRRTPVPTRREDLAELLGTTPETLSRTLHELARRGLVELDRKEVRVLDPVRLKRLAE
jgi:CRP/FNR family transcriptional regulator